MKKLFASLVALFASVAFGATTVPVQLLNPTGSSSGQAIVSTGASSAPAWGGVGVSGIAAIAANTVLANATGSSASPTALAVPSCSASGYALNWTSGTGFGCTTFVSSGRLLNVQVFTSTGTYTPTSGTNSIIVGIIGGGGGGGGAAATAASQQSCGAGGGSAAWSWSRITSGFSGVTVTIGAAGTGGSGASGGTGGTSTFGSIISAAGGSGGASTGAASTSGAVTCSGGAGGATATGGTLVNSGGQTAPYMMSVLGSGATGYVGSSSPWGSGGGPGNAGTGYGSGGGGTANNPSTSAATGGAGAKGFAIIYEYQ